MSRSFSTRKSLGFSTSTLVYPRLTVHYAGSYSLKHPIQRAKEILALGITPFEGSRHLKKGWFLNGKIIDQRWMFMDVSCQSDGSRYLKNNFEVSPTLWHYVGYSSRLSFVGIQFVVLFHSTMAKFGRIQLTAVAAQTMRGFHLLIMHGLSSYTSCLGAAVWQQTRTFQRSNLFNLFLPLGHSLDTLVNLFPVRSANFWSAQFSWVRPVFFWLPQLDWKPDLFALMRH